MTIGPNLLVLLPYSHLKNGQVLTQWDLVTHRMNLLIWLPCIKLKQLLGINTMGLSAPRAHYIGIISLQMVKKLRDIIPPYILESMNLWQIEKNTYIKHPQNIYQPESLSNNMNINFCILIWFILWS